MSEFQTKIDTLLLTQNTIDETLIVNILMDGYYTQIFRLAMSILQNEDDAEDVSQETIISAVRSIKQYTIGTNLKAWLFTMTVNKCRDNFRKHRRQQNYLLEWHNHKKTMFLPLSPEDMTLRSETREELWKAVNKLKDKHRVPIILRFVHGLPIKEISQILSCSEGTIHSRLHYAEKKLLTALRSDERLMKDFMEYEL